MPCDAEMTLGYAFIEFETTEQANKAIAGWNNKKFDQRHTLKVCPLAEFDRLNKYPVQYQPPTMEESEAQENLHEWLLDEEGRDQYVVRHGSDTEVFFHEALRKAGRTLSYGGQRQKEKGLTWTDFQVSWSPRGSYLATFHEGGIKLWGGKDFLDHNRFGHSYVEKIDFSPCEKYLVTYTTDLNEAGLKIFEVRSGKMVKFFAGSAEFDKMTWPFLKWSHDDAFFSRVVVEQHIEIYEAATMAILDERPIRATGVRDVEWCPSANVISYCA